MLFAKLWLTCPIRSPGFYTTFWQMSTYDLTVPMSKYVEQGDAIRSENKKAELEITIADRKGDRLNAGLHRQRGARFVKWSTDLAKEASQHMISREFASKRLKEERNHWFAHCTLDFYFEVA